MMTKPDLTASIEAMREVAKGVDAAGRALSAALRDGAGGESSARLGAPSNTAMTNLDRIRAIKAIAAQLTPCDEIPAAERRQWAALLARWEERLAGAMDVTLIRPDGSTEPVAEYQVVTSEEDGETCVQVGYLLTGDGEWRELREGERIVEREYGAG